MSEFNCEECWEELSQENYDELLSHIRRKSRAIFCDKIVDRLEQVFSLIEVCSIALNNKNKNTEKEYAQEQVCNVLCDYVNPSIRSAIMELNNESN